VPGPRLMRAGQQLLTRASPGTHTHVYMCISCAFRGETLIKLYMFFGLGRGKFHLPFHISCGPLGVCINLLKWFSQRNPLSISWSTAGQSLKY